MNPVLKLMAVGLVALSACADQPGGDDMNVSAEMPTATPSEDGLIYCDVVDTRLTADECSDLTLQNAKIYRGGAAINAPDPMWRGDSYAVTLIVDSRPSEVLDAIEAPRPPRSAGVAPTPEPSSTQADVAQSTGSPPEDFGPIYSDDATPRQILERLPGQTKRFKPKVGRFMQATLTGEGFEIVPLDASASKQLPPDSQARWAWKVTPQSGGSRTLFATTIVEGRVNGRNYPLAGSEMLQPVTIEVRWYHRIIDQLDFMPVWMKSLEGALLGLAGVIAALWAVWAALRNKRRRAEAP
jgi:hypothetical protein